MSLEIELLMKQESNLIVENNNLKNIKNKLTSQERDLKLNVEDYQNIVTLQKEKDYYLNCYIIETYLKNKFEKSLSSGVSRYNLTNKEFMSFFENLKSFKTDLEVTKKLAKNYANQIKENSISLVSESGLFNREDLDLVKSYGADAVLVGESLMSQEDILGGVKKLIGNL